MKYVLLLSLLFGCSAGSAHFVQVTPDGKRMPFVVECTPEVKNCKQLIIDTCHCHDYIVESKERVAFQTYRMEVMCR